MARSNLHRLIGNAKREVTVPVEQSFLADLNRTITKMDEEESRQPSKSYKPSSLNCIRNMYYQRTGTEQDPSNKTAEFVGICQTGSDRHEHLQRAVSRMKDFGIDCEYYDVETYIKEHNLEGHLEVKSKQGMETKLWHKHLNMSFLCDGIIRYNGEFYVLEIKTETSRKWYGRNEVDSKHHNQATAYALSFRINKILFIYESRDVCGKKTFMFEVPNSYVESVVERIETCEVYVGRLTPPPKPDDVEKSTCSYCNYKSTCRKDG